MKKILMTLTLALGAMIAIPAAAQNTATATEQTKECSKTQKACCKAEGGKACAKAEGKACCKEGKGHKRMMKDGQFAKGERKLNNPKGKQMRRGPKENPMMKGITLSEAQQEKMKALNEKNMEARKKSKADAKAKSKDEIQKLRADFDKEIEKILDKDQLKQYNANKAELEAKRAAKQDKLPKHEKKTK